MKTHEHRIASSRAEALALGLKTYFSNKKCVMGETSERLARNGQCMCQRCKESARQRTRRYKAENRSAVLSARRLSYQNNREAILEAQRQWRLENHEAAVSGQRSYRARNRTSISEYARAWAAKNIGKARELTNTRRAAKNSRIPSWFDEFDRFVLAEASDLAKLRTVATGTIWHVDHMIPLRCETASGLHCGKNIQVIPGFLNLRKNNKLWLTEPDQWIGALTAEIA